MALAWWGTGTPSKPHWGEVIHAGRGWLPGGAALLARVAANGEVPGIARATAVSLLPRYPGPETLASLERASHDEDPLVRRAAARAVDGAEPLVRLRIAGPLLSDPIRMVRLEAASVVAGVPAGLQEPTVRSMFDAAARELRDSLTVNADRSDGQENLGVLELALGRVPEAEAAFRLAVRRDPSFVPAYVNLADVLRETGRAAEAEQALREGLRWDPSDAVAHHALGLSLVRQGRRAEGLAELEQAARLAPGDPHLSWVLAVALHDSGQPRAALAVLEKAQAHAPANAELVSLLARYRIEAGDAGAAWPGAGRQPSTR